MTLRHGDFIEIETEYALGEDPKWQQWVAETSPTEVDLLAETPAQETPVVNYLKLQEAYDFFNAKLFENRLPVIVFTLRGNRHQMAYAKTPAFVTREMKQFDEIAMNPQFTSRDDIDILSTLVHEMTHIEQYTYGKPSAGGYHNKAWVVLMERIGLKPYNVTDKSKQTGRRVSHTIVPDGPFEAAARELLATGWTFDLAEPGAPAPNHPDDKREARAKQKRKTKYVCGKCSRKVWGKPDLDIICGACLRNFEEQE